MMACVCIEIVFIGGWLVKLVAERGLVLVIFFEVLVLEIIIQNGKLLVFICSRLNKLILLVL